MVRLLGPAAVALSVAAGPVQSARRVPPAQSSFSVVEATVAGMRQALAQRRVTSRQLVEQSLQRIAIYEDRLNAVITVNPRALAEADARDRERSAGRVRGPLHGIPIALKDNIQTSDLRTTGGALAFEELVPPYDATLTRLLREGGAVVIAKTGMTELANWVANGMPGNYNALTGFGMNPYDPRRDPRPAQADGRPVLPTGGSSSGIGTASSFWAANVGTETSGSILSPANALMLVGIKPTVGRVSRYGVIPITADQDTPGPMARTVADAAALLGVIEGRVPDSLDPATGRCTPPPNHDYTAYLDAGALKGARIGIPRAFYYEPTTPAGGTSRGGLNAAETAMMADVLRVLREQGAILVDPADVPSVLATDPDDNILRWPICAGANPKGKDEDCSVVFKYGMKRDFNLWLASLGASAPVASLGDLRAWNKTHERAGAIRYGQAILDVSDEMDVEADRARYEHDREKDLRLTAAGGIDAVMQAEHLDALLFPGASGAALAARPGYPTVIVPFGMLPLAGPPFPSWFMPKPAPVGVSFTAAACAEPRLIALAYAFEQATKRRFPPPLP